jgi:hypothetical protein
MSTGQVHLYPNLARVPNMNQVAQVIYSQIMGCKAQADRMKAEYGTLAAAILSLYYKKTGQPPKQLNLIIKPLVQAINFEKNSIISEVAVKGLFALIEVLQAHQKEKTIVKILNNLIKTLSQEPYESLVKDTRSADESEVSEKRVLIGQVKSFAGINSFMSKVLNRFSANFIKEKTNLVELFEDVAPQQDLSKTINIDVNC